MHVFISTDIEGITGIASWSQCGRPAAEHFDFRWARERYTADVNAAIEGCRQAGAGRIILKDSHGNSKNLLIDDLAPGVELVTGHGSRTDGMMNGIDPTCSAAILIGYHAMAGTRGGTLEHTISGRIHRLWFNGREMGEIGLSALTAGHYGVPIVAVSSDHAGCAEAAGLIPGVETIEVKLGYGRFMCQTRHPAETGPAITHGVAAAISRRAEIAALVPDEACTVRIEFNRTEEADLCERIPGVSRLDGYSLEFGPHTFPIVHRAIGTFVAMAQMGAGSDT
jgi:D-amino peptidase